MLRKSFVECVWRKQSCPDFSCSAKSSQIVPFFCTSQKSSGGQGHVGYMRHNGDLLDHKNVNYALVATWGY